MKKAYKHAHGVTQIKSRMTRQQEGLARWFTESACVIIDVGVDVISQSPQARLVN